MAMLYEIELYLSFIHSQSLSSFMNKILILIIHIGPTQIICLDILMTEIIKKINHLDWSSAWRNKLHVIIILRAHSCKMFCHQRAPLPHLICALYEHCHWLRTGYGIQGPTHICYRHNVNQEDRYGCKNMRFWRK